MRKGGNGLSPRTGSQTSRVHGSENQNPFDMLCECPTTRRVVYRISKTTRNPGRAFIACPLSLKDGGCGYFRWVDQLEAFNMGNWNEERSNGESESKVQDNEEIWKAGVMGKLDGIGKDVRVIKSWVALLCVLLSLCFVLLIGRKSD